MRRLTRNAARSFAVDSPAEPTESNPRVKLLICKPSNAWHGLPEDEEKPKRYDHREPVMVVSEPLISLRPLLRAPNLHGPARTRHGKSGFSENLTRTSLALRGFGLARSKQARRRRVSWLRHSRTSKVRLLVCSRSR